MFIYQRVISKIVTHMQVVNREDVRNCDTCLWIKHGIILLTHTHTMEDPKEQLLLYLGTGHKGQSHVLGMM